MEWPSKHSAKVFILELHSSAIYNKVCQCENGRKIPVIMWHLIELQNLVQMKKKCKIIVTRLGWGKATTTLLKQIGWLSVKQLYVYHSLLLVFKMQQSGKPAYLKEKFRNNFAYRTRQATRSCFVISETPRTEKSRKSFVHSNIITWNSLPADIRKIDKLPRFKQKLKEWVLKNVQIWDALDET